MIEALPVIGVTPNFFLQDPDSFAWEDSFDRSIVELRLKILGKPHAFVGGALVWNAKCHEEEDGGAGLGSMRRFIKEEASNFPKDLQALFLMVLKEERLVDVKEAPKVYDITSEEEFCEVAFGQTEDDVAPVTLVVVSEENLASLASNYNREPSLVDGLSANVREAIPETPSEENKRRVFGLSNIPQYSDADRYHWWIGIHKKGVRIAPDMDLFIAVHSNLLRYSSEINLIDPYIKPVAGNAQRVPGSDYSRLNLLFAKIMESGSGVKLAICKQNVYDEELLTRTGSGVVVPDQNKIREFMLNLKNVISPQNLSKMEECKIRIVKIHHKRGLWTNFNYIENTEGFCDKESDPTQDLIPVNKISKPECGKEYKVDEKDYFFSPRGQNTLLEIDLKEEKICYKRSNGNWEVDCISLT
tara:strand:- start:646 stop:1890 length:1245 start_codon:yes stop_codon:yes gene_type:complete